MAKKNLTLETLEGQSSTELKSFFRRASKFLKELDFITKNVEPNLRNSLKENLIKTFNENPNFTTLDVDGVNFTLKDSNPVYDFPLDDEIDACHNRISDITEEYAELEKLLEDKKKLLKEVKENLTSRENFLINSGRATLLSVNKQISISVKSKILPEQFATKGILSVPLDFIKSTEEEA